MATTNDAALFTLAAAAFIAITAAPSPEILVSRVERYDAKVVRSVAKVVRSVPNCATSAAKAVSVVAIAVADEAKLEAEEDRLEAEAPIEVFKPDKVERYDAKVDKSVENVER